MRGLVGALACVAGFSVQATAGEIVSVTPTGAVKQVQQVTARFSTDMVPMGDPRSQKDPFNVTCTGKDEKTKVEVPKASSRWIDAKNWSYDFAKPLAAGIRCTLRPVGLTDLDRKPVSGADLYSFSTGGPAILLMLPRYGDIEPEQFFVVQTDGPMDIESVKNGAYFESAKIMSRIGVRVIEGVEREKVLRAAVNTSYQFRNLKAMLAAKKPFAQIREFDSLLVLAGKNRFAESSSVALHWSKAIKSTSGIAVEEPQKFEFDVIAPFEAKFSCERVNPESPCNPILGMRLQFSRVVDRKLLAKVVLQGPKGEKWIPVEFDKKAPKSSYRDQSDFIDSLTFAAPFPDRAEFKIVIPKLVDELGRTLVNQDKYPLVVKTDDFTPLVKFAAPFGVLEKNADPILPVSLRNVEKNIAGQAKELSGKTFSLKSAAPASEVIRLYRSVIEKEDRYEARGEALLQDSNSKSFRLPKPGGERDFELVGIPLKEPGLHVVELQSPALGRALLGGPPMYVAGAALVTNLSVHLKEGRESSLVWVTTLDHAKPVANAEVSLLNSAGTVLASGKTDSSGIWRVGPVGSPCKETGRYGEECDVYAFAKLGDDMSFVSNRWSRGIEEYRFNLQSEYIDAEWGPLTAHAVLDRALLQAGETLHFKTYLRHYSAQGFKSILPERVPKRLTITHGASGKTFSIPFVFDAKTGTAVSEFKVPKDATLGSYEIRMSQSAGSAKNTDVEADAYDWRARSLGSFTVAEYRLPLMESTVKIQSGQMLVRPSEVKADLSASYLSGGPAADLKVKVRASIQPGYFSPDIPNANDYTFFSTPLKVETSDETRAEAQPDLAYVFNQDLTLAQTGGALAVIRGLPSVSTVRSLIVEMEYRDPNGEVKTGRGDATLYPSDTIVGLRSDSWVAKAGQASVAGIIINPNGKPVAGQNYVVEAFQQEYISHRKRLVGGFYSYDSSSKTKSLGQVCRGVSNATGEFTCTASKLPSGSIILQARVTDSKSRATTAMVSFSVYEEGEMTWWTPSDSDRIDLLPEKVSYEPGETAKFVLRSPFPTSQVLVTVDREGVLDAFVREVKRDQPLIEVPVKGHYAPNIFVSALALRGRVGDPKPTALIDLGKPTMKLGMTSIKVGWKAHELKVAVTTDKKTYRARDKAQAVVKVTRADGSPLKTGETEVVISVLDESIALLKKNPSLDLLSGMMRQRPLGVSTSSSQNQVIGKRHFGSKAKPPGGGGGYAVGGAENREFFDPLLLWSARVKLDANGEAKVVIPLNDSMTSFRISAAAHSELNYFGSGSTVIRSTKDLILYSGFAPVVRDGDQIKNALTVRNTTASSMKVDLTVTSPQIPTLAKVPSFTLRASEAKVIEIPVTVPPRVKQIEYVIAAKDSQTGFTDQLKFKTRVDEAVPAQVLQATLFQLEKSNSIPVQQPKDAIADRGGLVVDSKASLMVGLAGVKSYMDAYPYTCLEQKVSKAIALEDEAGTKELLNTLPSYIDAGGLLKFFPTSICGSHQLTGYILQIAKVNGYEIPAVTRDRVLQGLTSWMRGQTCSNWWDRYVRNTYLDQERVIAMNVLSMYGRFDLPAMKTVKVTPNLWKTTTLVAFHRLLARESAIENRDTLLKQVEMILRSRVNYQGSLMNLQGDLDWEAGWSLFSSRDQEALAVFGLAIDLPSFQDDVGKIARGVTARYRKGRWDTTMANAWGVTELRRFSAKFEKTKVSGVTSVKAVGVDYALDWGKKPSGDNVLLPWPTGTTGAAAKSVPVLFAHQGSGAPWVILQTKSAIPLKAPLDLGYSVVRKVTRVTSEGGTQSGVKDWKNGDVANIELTITAKNDQPWVVVRDPIPGGASHLGTGLDGSSMIMDRAPKTRPSANQIVDFPTEFEEKSHSHFTTYAAYLMKGTYKTNYRIRLNSSGALKLPPTHVEALYSPETFGDAPNAVWSIAP